MTKTTRILSYLSHVIRHHHSHLPLLKPTRTLTRYWGTLPFRDGATETTQPVQPSSVRANSLSILQNFTPLSAQHVRELPPALPTTKTVQLGVEEEATSPSSPRPSALHTPVALAGSSTVPEESALVKSQRTSNATPELAPMTRDRRPEIRLAPAKSQQTSNVSAPLEPSLMERNQLPQAEIQSVPAKSTRSVAAEIDKTSIVMQVTSDRQTRAPGKEKSATVTLHPLPRQQKEAMITPTNSRSLVNFLGQESKASASASEPQRRPTPHGQETQQRTAIHIGTIDIHIVPPAPPVPLPPARSTTAGLKSTSTLSCEMTSFIGLRQG
jgi:hypothetical protein